MMMVVVVVVVTMLAVIKIQIQRLGTPRLLMSDYVDGIVRSVLCRPDEQDDVSGKSATSISLDRMSRLPNHKELLH
jgi:hypothetical protein